MNTSSQRVLKISVLLFCWIVTREAAAGGGPENVFLVVNSADQDSLTIANYFVHWRKIPAICVFDISWPQAPFDTDIETFRQRILKQTLDEIDRRKLTQQIDYIVYSSGFPYAINFSSDLGGKTDSHPIASITGLTYLHTSVMDKSMQIRSRTSNVYAKNVMDANSEASHGFRSQYGIDLLGKRVKRGSNGQRYHLSMMLGYTTGQRNNTLREVLTYLKNGVKADGKRPKGTIYFVRNSNIRSKVREGAFAAVADELTSLGVRAKVIDGKNNERDVLPVKKKDVQGTMVGYFKLTWKATGSNILPGAICENFTSFGGRMTGEHNQTLLSHFLKFGAVASSGTVVEPYAVAAKFPHPRMHLHYARGCSVAEAYYQAVVSPYQLLIVGDPLCQPWAVTPQVSIKGINTKKKLSGVVEAKVEVTSKSGNSIRNYDVFVDGQLVLQLLPDEPLILDTRQLANGHHELRVVAIEDTAIETQGRAILGFVCINLPDTADYDSAQTRPTVGVASRLSPKPRGGKLMPGEVGSVRVRSGGAREIRLYHGRDLLGSVIGDSGRIQIDTRKLGGGPVTLKAVAFPKDPQLKPVMGFPLEVQIALPAVQGG